MSRGGRFPISYEGAQPECRREQRAKGPHQARDASATALRASPAWCAGAVLPSAPSGPSPPTPATAAAASAAAPPVAANYWRWSLERAGESRAAELGYARLWPISAPPSGLRAWGGAKARGAGRGGASRKLTHWQDQVVRPPSERAPESVEAPRASRQGQEDWVEWGGGRAGDETEHSRELRASLVCRFEKR